MKITHWGEDYAILKVGRLEFEIHLRLAKAIEKELQKGSPAMQAMNSSVQTMLKLRRQAAAAMGSVSSKKKSDQARENGKKGGRPRKAK